MDYMYEDKKKAYNFDDLNGASDNTYGAQNTNSNL
jgi:hypothetical protein